MQRDARCYLWDALKSAEAIQAFLRGKTYEAFIEDDLVRSAVERQLQIIGEALSQPARVDPQIAGGVAELPRIIALIEDKLPELQTNLRMPLRAADPSPNPSA